MKIAVWNNLPSGGGKRALHAQVLGLLERGHQLESWCPPTANRDYLPLHELVLERVLPLDLPARPGRRRPLKRLWWSSQQTAARLRAVEKHCRLCVGEIERGGFDVLLAGPCTLFHTTPIGRLTRLPSVLYLQEPYRSFFEASPQLPWVALDAPTWRDCFSPPWIKRFLKNALTVRAARVQLREEIRNARGFTAVLVNSLFSRESLLRGYGMNSHFSPLGIDIDLFPFSVGPRKPQVISVGHLYRGKGAERSIKAVAEVPAHKRPRLLWVGNGSNPDYQASMESLASSLHVEFLFESNVPDATLVRHLQESLAMIYTPRLEPFGYAPLEANSCGTPVVTIAEGGMRETVHDGVNGFAVRTEEPAALAAALLRIIDDPAAASLRVSSRKYVEDNWSLALSTDHLERALHAARSAVRTAVAA